MTERMGYWVDLSQAYRTMDARLRRERVVVAQADLGQGPARAGPPGGAVLPAVRHPAVGPRARPGLRDGRRPVGLRALPGARRPASRARRRAARVDDHAVDAGVEHRGRGEPGRHLRRCAHRRGRGARGGRAAARRDARRGRRGAREPSRHRTGARAATSDPSTSSTCPASPASTPPTSCSPGTSRPRTARDWSTSPRPSAPTTSRWGAPTACRWSTRCAPTAPSPRTSPSSVASSSRRRTNRSSPTSRRAGCSSGTCRTSTATRTAGAATRRSVLRAAVVVHPHDRGQGPAARGERGDRLVPADDPVGPVRRLAAQQHRLGAVAQPLLGHAPADLALRRRADRARDVRRVARRAR